jgi:hypothetical protein
MTLAIGGLKDPATGAKLGTVFAVTGRLALTAFHCVEGRESGKVRCEWAGAISHAVVEDGDREDDVALLRLDEELPQDLDPVRLATDVIEHTRFSAPGHPVAVAGVSPFAISGEVTWLEGALGGASVIQLASKESAAELSLRGMSGSPVLVGHPLRAAGVIRWNPPRDDRPELAAGGALFATPSITVLRHWPQLDLANAADASDLRRLFQRITRRSPGRDGTELQAYVCELLVAGGLGLSEYDLAASNGSTRERLHYIAIRRARVVIVISEDIRIDGAAESVEQWLEKYLSARMSETSNRHLGIMTDGAQWRLYHLIDSKLHQVGSSLTVGESGSDSEKLLSWLEAVLATRQQIEPTPDEIKRKLGSKSPAYALDTAELRAMYAKHRDQPTVRVKRAIWAKLLTTASGVSFADEDWLFVDHTLLVAMAEVIGHGVLGFSPTAPEVSAADIMSGWHFSEAAIGGVIESDFFDWVVHVPGGEQFIKELARRIMRFAWNHVEHDVMKVLYQSIISEETRHQLGEYYTPDWLAEKIITDCVENPLDQRVLDASCGSGTFLFHAVRRYVTAAEAAGRTSQEILSSIGDKVIGFDVHPVAVTLARVTYLLAIGMHHLTAHGRPSFTVPVYLGDSLHWGQETSLFSQDLSVLTNLDHEAFLSDPGLVGPDEDRLIFPESIVANAGLFDRLMTELADQATQRERRTPPPSLAGVFQQFKIDSNHDRSMLTDTFEKMCDLHDNEKDHIWGYYVRNLARPTWLARPANRVDVLVGNPPWLAYHFMTKAQKASFREMCKNRGLWAGATVAPHQDLSALFVARCIEQYLRAGGKFGYVMPLAVLTRRQYVGFRGGDYRGTLEPLKVSFEQPWDLHGIKPAFFRQSVCTIFGRRHDSKAAIGRLDVMPDLWSGSFDTEFASWADAAPHISRVTAEPSPVAITSSPYRGRFFQGATVVPRFLFLVKHDEAGPLGTGPDRQAVQSRRRAKENKRFKNLKPLRGNVERQFIRPLYLGDSIAPFRCMQPFDSVIPWNGTRLLDHGDGELIQFQGLARWWRNATAVWAQHGSEQLSLKQRLDYQRGLTRQFPAAAYRVVFNKSGMYLAAAVLEDQSAIIDHTLIWGGVETSDEARYLTAVLNSTVVTNAVQHLQVRGEHNPRHFDKYVFQLPVPLYVADNERHRQLVTLARRAEGIAEGISLPDVSFEAQRRRIRQVLETQGITAEIDAIVKLLLTLPSGTFAHALWCKN